MKYTLQLVGEFRDAAMADEVADQIAQDNDLAIMSVRQSTRDEIAGFNPEYLQAMTQEERTK